MDPASRHQARERALSLLYEAELKGDAPSVVVAGLPAEPDGFVVDLLAAVEDGQEEIDRMIDDASIGWDVGRLAVVDRIVLRMAVAELRSFPDVPVAVVLNEAVELATAYSTEESGRFVNGVLATLATLIRG